MIDSRVRPISIDEQNRRLHTLPVWARDRIRNAEADLAELKASGTGKTFWSNSMGRDLDLDDVVAQYPEAKRELEQLRKDLAAARALLPGVYYMDPPDGGQVEVLEQLRRMADDAARYRYLRNAADACCITVSAMSSETDCYRGTELDAAIDAALAGKDAP